MGEQDLILWPVGVKHCGYTLETSSVNEQRNTQKNECQTANERYSAISTGFY